MTPLMVTAIGASSPPATLWSTPVAVCRPSRRPDDEGTGTSGYTID